MTSIDGTHIDRDPLQLQNIEPCGSSAIREGYCQGAGMGATILRSGVEVLAVPSVPVAICVTRKHCHGDNVSQVPLRSVRFFGFPRSSVGFYRLVITVWIQSL